MFNVLFGCGGIPKKTCLLLNTLVKAFTNQYSQRKRPLHRYIFMCSRTSGSPQSHAVQAPWNRYDNLS